jgi:hypothetical protein
MASSDEYECTICGLVMQADEQTDHSLAHRLQDDPQPTLIREVVSQYPREDSSGFIRSPSLEEGNSKAALAQIERMRLSEDSSEGLSRFLSNELYSDGALLEAGVESLPRVVYEAEFHHEVTDCMVCMTAFQQGEVNILLPCFHYFHTECVGPWLRQKAICPSCRVKV